MSNTNPLDEQDREDLSAYLDGELDKKTARALEAKLSIDPVARGEAETLRRAWDMLDYLPRPEPSPNFTHRTMERLSAQLPKSELVPRAPARTWIPGLAWAAAVLLAATAGFAGMNSLTQRQHDDADQQLVRDLRIIENVKPFEHVDDIDFLHKLANPNDPDLFGDEQTGS